MEIKSFQETIPQITFLIKKKLWAQVIFGLFLGLVNWLFSFNDNSLTMLSQLLAFYSWGIK